MTEPAVKIPTLALGKSFHGETVIIPGGGDGIQKKLMEFCHYHQLNVIERDGLTIISTLMIQVDRKGNEYIYGGKAFTDKYGLIIGSNDIERLEVDVNDIKECCGEYHLITFEEAGIQIRADWFGYQPLFHYNSQKVSAVSTSYHLLLLVLKVLGESIEIDLPHAYDLVKEKWTFTSNLSVELKNCVCNRTYEYFDISLNRINVKRTSAYESLYVDGDYSDAIYEELIHKARAEILGHVRMVFEHPAFDSVVVDLSGGFDTRLVYAACTVLPDSLIGPKIRISSRSSATPNDFEIAVSVNSIYNYPYFSDAAKNVLLPTFSDCGDMLFANNISKSLGTYKDWTAWSLADSYYVANVASVYGGCGDLYHGFEMQRTEQIDNYIENRNRFHFRQPFRNSYPVLMSKAAARLSQLFRRRHHHSDWKKVSIDILTLMNPLLVTLPFANPAIVEFFNDPEKVAKLYRFPYAKGEPNRVIVGGNYIPLYIENSNPDEVIYNIRCIERVCERLRKLSPEFDALVSGQLQEVLERRGKTTILFRWWSLFWVLEMIDGRGDFFEGTHLINTDSLTLV